MKKIFGPASVEEASAKIVRRLLKCAFRLFRNSKFRALAGFGELNQSEQDRIFNELEVTGLVLCNLMIEMMAQITDVRERASFFSAVKEQIPQRFIEFLKQINIPKSFIKQWQKLIELRTDEYYGKRLEYRDDLPKPEEGNPWVPLISTGCLFHIRRGNPPLHDPLFRVLYRWVGELAMDVQKILWHHVKRF